MSAKRSQSAVEKLAKRLPKKAGGGEATIKNRRGKIRDSDPVKRGNNPRSSKHRRHQSLGKRATGRPVYPVQRVASRSRRATR